MPEPKYSTPTCPTAYCPVALIPIVIKCLDIWFWYTLDPVFPPLWTPTTRKGAQKLQSPSTNMSAYRKEVDLLAVWCDDNNLLNTKKTKEIMLDFRRKADIHPPIYPNGAAVEHVTCLKIPNDLRTSPA